jgi:iron complex outermembrane receptor protein
MKYSRSTWTCFALAFAMGAAQATEDPRPPQEELHELNFDELIHPTITSVSKRESQFTHAATAVSVVTAEDIRRLGITRLPEALRLIPGLDVARINAWSF